MFNIPWQKPENQLIIQNTFDRFGIKGWNNWKFTQYTLVVGENGAGKSRLLRAIRDICQASSVLCIYMDFTQIDKERVQCSAKTANLANPLLYYGSLSNDAYLNFIPFLEENTEKFLSFLNGLDSEQIKLAMGQRRVRINDFLKEQLGRELVFGDEGCRITSREENRSPLQLAEALKEMSPGERCILYFALGILCISKDEQTNKEFVLLLDEPENHLHAKALVRLIEEVNNLKDKGIHVVVASHSIFLVPLFRFEDILFISKSGISKATSSIYTKAFNALISDQDEESDKFKDMLSSLSKWNFSNYLAECLCEPTVSDEVKKDDKQFRKLFEILKSLLQRKEIKLLDYGGGSGRIAKCLELHLRDNPNDSLVKKLKYDVYDLNLDRSEMPDASWMGRTYKKDENSFLTNGSYDLVVLYNVLHEVDVTEWTNTLNYILSLLKDEGLLIFGERMTLSQGERPYGKSGYLVLNHDELLQLFGDNHVSTPIELADDGKDPTICCVISEPRSIKVDINSVLNAVQHLFKRSKEKIKLYINRQTEVIKPREYAFYCQQNINAEHAIDLLSQNGEIQKDPLINWTCADIINNSSGTELIRNMKKRATIQDDEGEKCRIWLEHNAN